jgi:formate hydrogenlyase subunit 4
VTPVAMQAFNMLLVLGLAPLLTGLVRKVKARLQGRRGPSPAQPYRDLVRLLRKDAVLASNASWLFRVTPYLVFTTLWLAASLVPSLTSDVALGPAADLIALTALLGSARFFTALAGLDVGTSFGGIGASREMMIASLAEPAMLMVVFTVSLLIGSTSLSTISQFIVLNPVGLRISLAMAFIALTMVAIAETGRVPIDNPTTHLELTMVHEAMILEYSGRHLALMEAAGMLKLLLYLSLIICIFAPFGMAIGDAPLALAIGLVVYLVKVALGGVLLGVFETSIAKMRVFRVSEFLGGAFIVALLAILLLDLSRSL